MHLCPQTMLGPSSLAFAIVCNASTFADCVFGPQGYFFPALQKAKRVLKSSVPLWMFERNCFKLIVGSVPLRRSLDGKTQNQQPRRVSPPHNMISKMKDFDLHVCQYDGPPTASAAVQEHRIVVFTEYDNAESLISSIYDSFSISGSPRLLLYYQRPPNDPDEEVPFRQITPQAVAGSLLQFLATGDARKQFTLPENDQIDLAFTLQPQQEAAAGAGAAVPSGRTAVMSTSGHGKCATPAGSSAGASAQSTVKPGYRAGKSQQLPWMDYAKELCRNNLIRENDGTYYMITDKVPEPGKSCHIGLTACRAACLSSPVCQPIG